MPRKKTTKSTSTKKPAGAAASNKSSGRNTQASRKGTGARSAAKTTTKKKTTKARSSTKSKGSCFVISPFGGWFDTYYESIYCPAVEAAGLKPRRADDLYRPSSIVSDIWAFVTEAKVLLADLTDKNPNVLYELGLAHAIGKPVVLLTQDIDDVPFDLRPLRVIEYDVEDPAWAELLREKIQSALKEVLASPDGAVPATFLKERDTKSPSVTPAEKRLRELEQQMARLSRRERSKGEAMVGPSEARELISRYVGRGMSKEAIMARMRALDVPTVWAERRIREAIAQAVPD